MRTAVFAWVACLALAACGGSEQVDTGGSKTTFSNFGGGHSSGNGSGGSSSCHGTADACSTIPSTNCSAQDGCYSRSGDAFCGGTAWTCDSYRTSGSCDAQLGCDWH